MGKELGIKSILELDEEEKPLLDIKKSKKMQVFRALNPFINGCGFYLGVPFVGDHDEKLLLSDEERLEALKDYLLLRKEELVKEKIRNA